MCFYVLVIATVFVYVQGVAWTEVLATGKEKINMGNILIEEPICSGFSVNIVEWISQRPSCYRICGLIHKT